MSGKQKYTFCEAKSEYSKYKSFFFTSLTIYNARFYQLGINLGIANPRSEDNPRFILGSSFSVLSTFSNLGTTNLGITRLSL